MIDDRWLLLLDGKVFTPHMHVRLVSSLSNGTVASLAAIGRNLGTKVMR